MFVSLILLTHPQQSNHNSHLIYFKKVFLIMSKNVIQCVRLLLFFSSVNGLSPSSIELEKYFETLPKISFPFDSFITPREGRERNGDFPNYLRILD